MGVRLHTGRIGIAIAAGLAVAVLAAAAVADGVRHTPTAGSTGVVASVYDGDTLTLRSGARVRLLQIDTPELGSGECYSRAARSALVRLAPPGSVVTLEADARLDRVDRYGRLLRYVLRGGRDVNLELVRQGAAAPYFYRGERGRHAVALMTAARMARAARLGLWRACPGTRLAPEAAVETGAERVSGEAAAGGRCDPNYRGGCVPPYPPDLDCADLRRLGIGRVRVVGADPHRLDGDRDGWGCE
jgi:endonuclease YncB( thermonuclease family)